MHQITRLSSGLTVTTKAMPHMASVSLGLWVGVGGRFEPAELNGVSHFIEHLLFKGTFKRKAKEISQAVEGIGGYLNAFTGEESTCFYAKAGRQHIDELLDVLLDMLLNSRFDQADIDKEREVIKEEVAMYLDQPQQRVQELLNDTLWPDQPLGRPLAGTEKTLDRIGREQLRSFLGGNYISANTIVAAAGNVNHRQLVKLVSRFATRLPTGRKPAFAPARAQQRRPAIRQFVKKTEQTQIALGIRTCSRHDSRRFALRLLNTILGENMSSRLFQIIREDHGLAYSIYSSLSFFDDVGVLTISAGLDPGNLPRVLKLIAGEMRRLSRTTTTRAELRRARDYVIGQMDLSLESTENQMMWLGEYLLGYGTIPHASDVRRRLSEVTASQIRAVARDFFRPERLNLALVSPQPAPRAAARLLHV